MSSGEQFPIASDLQQTEENWTRWPAVDMETLYALLADSQVQTSKLNYASVSFSIQSQLLVYLIKSSNLLV